MEHEILHDQITEVFGWIRQSNPEHLPKKLIPAHPLSKDQIK